ncbi:TRIO and F-actin-binding protein [Echinops telfairi]|uniref:TRIO and F-actin-binding protein n=1 Tax=Echinops telfairi TaxID=9371 RepID=A0ABM0ZPU2_ECHTE|nr:TRIO and F-actin-binding protein [Echinops telfairi]
MEPEAGNASCEHFETDMHTQCLRQNCPHPEEPHGARHQVGWIPEKTEMASGPRGHNFLCEAEGGPHLYVPAPLMADPPRESMLESGSPVHAEALYCDLPRRPPAPPEPLAASTSSRPSGLGPDLGPERSPGREDQAASLSGSCDSEEPGCGPSSSAGGDTPDDTSCLSSVDWDTVERQGVPSVAELPKMIPRRIQEGPRTDSTRRAPSLLSRPPVGTDVAGQRQEDTSSGRQHWAKLRGEGGYFSLDRLRAAPAQAVSSAPQSGPRSATSFAHRSAQRDATAQAASPQQDAPRASSPPQTPRWDNPRASATPRSNPHVSSPSKSTQQENSSAASAHQDGSPTASPTRTLQRDSPRTPCAQRDPPRTSSPNRTAQRESPRTPCAQRDPPRTSSPNRTTQQDHPRTPCAQRDPPRTSSPNRTTQQDHPRTSCTQPNTLRSSSTQRDSPKPSAPRDNPRSPCPPRGHVHCSSTPQSNPRPSSSQQRDNPGRISSQCCTQPDNPGPASPHRASPRKNPRNSSPHRTNKDIPWASFPLRPTQSDGPRTSSPARAKQSEVPWASIALRPTQGDRPPTAAPARPAQLDSALSSGPLAKHNSPCQAASSSQNPGHHSAARTASPLYPLSRGASQTSDSSQPQCAVCIGHRDAPRASSPPRYLQHDPFPFFPEPRASESDSVHHDPPYMPPAVCIGHRDAPRASSPPRHTQFDPFPFLPEIPDAEDQSPQHDPPQLPPLVCIGYRDAPRASSPPRQAPEPALLFQDIPRASTESLAPSTDSVHMHPHIPTPVCIGHRDAPYFSSPPRQAPEPSLLFQDPPGASMESLAPSTDSLQGCALLPPQVCIGHRDAPRASSPPRHPPSDLVLLALSPPPGSSGGSRGSAPPGETRHNLEREEYTVLADLPPPRRLAQREPGAQAQGSNGGRTRSPGRAEVERLFGQERRKPEAPGASQARDEGRSQRPGQGQSQLLRRQSSPALSREPWPHPLVTVSPPKQAEPARRSRAEAPRARIPERHPEGDRRLQGSSQPPRTSARTLERECQAEGPAERGRGGPGKPLGVRQSQEAPPGPRSAPQHLERNCSFQESPGPGESSWGAARGPEGTWRGPSREAQESWGQPSEAWKETPRNSVREELASPYPPMSPPGLSPSRQPEIASTTDWGAEGTGPPPRDPEKRSEFDWRDLLSLFQVPTEGTWAQPGESLLAAHLPRLAWEGFLGLLQARLPSRDSAGHQAGPAKSSEPELGPPSTKGIAEPESHSQPEAWAEATLANGHSPEQWPQRPAQPPSPACTSTQWPKTKVTSGPESSPMADLEESGRLRSWSPEEGPSSPEREFQPEKPEVSEPSRDQDSLTDLKQADSADKRPAEGKAGSPLRGRLVTSWRMPGDRPTLFNPLLLSLGVLRWQRPDLLNFKKGWMSILDEPGEQAASCGSEWAGPSDGLCWRPRLSDHNKENALHSHGTLKGSLKAGEQRAGSEVIGRGGPRKADGQRQPSQYVQLSPLTQGTPQRVRPAARTADRPAKQEELERGLAQRSEERRKWFEATDGRVAEPPSPGTGEGPRRGLGAPLTEDQQSRLSEEIEKKWQELEKLPLRESKRVPLTALLSQGRGERRGPSSDSHEALEKEVQCLRAQLEVWRLRGEAPQDAPQTHEDSPVPPGYISQEACERSLAEMESSHQQVMQELQQHHKRELQRLQQEKEWLLAEETAATASAIEAMKKAYQEELSRELNKTRSLQQGPDSVRKQHQSDVEALKRELQVLSEQYSQKCLEIRSLTRQAEERELTLRHCQQEGQELLRHNQELHTHLSEEIDRLRSFIASQGAGNSGGRGSERSSCELEVLLRVKENELQYLKKEVQCLRDELQTMQKDKRLTSGKQQDACVEQSHVRTRSEREIEQLREHLRLAMAALQEKEATRNSLAD